MRQHCKMEGPVISMQQISCLLETGCPRPYDLSDVRIRTFARHVMCPFREELKSQTTYPC
jgi:hypothetical protein